MIKQLLKKSVLRIYFGLFLLIPLTLFAQPRYNVVKDNGFENNDTIWVEYESVSGWLGLSASRHVHPGYNSQYCGFTGTLTDPGAPFDRSYYCYLEQKLIKRDAKNYNLGNNVRYYLKIGPANEPTAYDYWYISFVSSKKQLMFFYLGPNAGKIPKEDDTTHIVEMKLPTTNSWQEETLNFYEKWTEKFSEIDTIEKIMFVSYLYRGTTGAQGQNVWWDDIVFESTRPDSDAAVMDIGFSGNPNAKVENKGAVAISFPTICDIFKGGNRVYSDTVNVESLVVDSIKQVSFKPYSDTGEMKIYTALPGDQDPNNDTLTKSLAVEEKSISFRTKFKVWPTLTKSLVNYESNKPVTVYDPTGRVLIKTEKGRGKLLLKDTGIYFLKSENDVKKVIRIK